MTNTVLKAEDAVYGGYVISRSDGVVFIKGAIPGEVVEVSLKEKKRDYSVAVVSDVIEPSDSRIEPRCPYFGQCGGCQLQFISYDRQVQMKEAVLRDCLRRIGDIQTDLLPPLFGPDFHYRQRAQFKVSREGAIGFFREGTRDVVAIEECPLMAQEINEALKRVKNIDRAGIKEIHITKGDTLSALVKGLSFNEALAEQFMAAGFSTVAFDDESYRGGGFVTLDLNGLIYTVSPWSFFQSNWGLNTEVVKIIADEVGSAGAVRVLDLYAGAGNFSLPLARAVSSVTAIEENPHAIRDGNRNAAANDIRNFKFQKGRAETARLSGNFDVVILDPPRPGLTGDAMKAVLEAAPKRIVYVSCNPSTLARDLKRLAEGYALESVRMIDLFPNTYHVESLAFLSRKVEEEKHQ